MMFWDDSLGDDVDENDENARDAYDRLEAARDAYWEAKIDAKRNGDDDYDDDWDFPAR
jgi:hypothetical protein